MKNYDEIIGKVIISMYELHSYVAKNEPSKADDVKQILQRVTDIDLFMAYGMEE
jgi:hypothetical protein